MIIKEKYVKLVMVIIILALLTLLNPYFHNLVADVFSKEQYNIESLWSLSLDNISKVEGVTGESIIVRDKGVLKAVNADNEELWSIGISDSEEVLTIRDNQICYYNNDNKKLTSIDNKGHKNWTLQYENLVDIKHFNNNLIGVYFKEKDGAALIEIIDIKGEVTGFVSIQEGVLLDYDIDYKSSKIIVTTMTVKDDQILNTVFLAGFNGEIYWWDMSDEKIITKCFIYQNQISTFDGETIITMNHQREILWSMAVEATDIGFSQNKEFIYAYDIPESKSNIINNKKPISITLVDKKGQRLSHITSDDDNPKIKSLGNYVINIGKRNIYIYSKEGKEVFDHYTNRDIVDVYISTDENIIVVYRKELECYRFSTN